MSETLAPVTAFREARSGQVKPVTTIGRVTIAGFVDMKYVLDTDPRSLLPLLMVDGNPALPPYQHGGAVEATYYTLGAATIMSELKYKVEDGLIQVRDASRIIIPESRRRPFMYEFCGHAARDVHFFPEAIGYDSDAFAAQASEALATAC